MASRRKSPNSVIQENSSTHLLVDQTSKMLFAGLIHQQTSFSPHHAGVPGSRIISASGLIWTILFWTWRKHLTVVLILMWYVFVKIWCQTSRFSYLTSFLSDTESKKNPGSRSGSGLSQCSKLGSEKKRESRKNGLNISRTAGPVVWRWGFF